MKKWQKEWEKEWEEHFPRVKGYRNYSDSLNSLIFEKIRLVINSFKILEQRNRDPNEDPEMYHLRNQTAVCSTYFCLALAAEHLSLLRI